MHNKKVLSKIDLGSYTQPNPYKNDIIYDPRGQWEHPGQNTRIPGGDITMQNVPYPVWAQPNVGPGTMMHGLINLKFLIKEEILFMKTKKEMLIKCKRFLKMFTLNFK